MKQCTCGRSKAYPYCDGTHKVKKEVIEQVNTTNTQDDNNTP
jgi:CDGSH-type Zn-finger protein